jgi:hypothetical protein
MTMTQAIRKRATEDVLKKLAGLGYSVDEAGRRALEGRVDAAIKRHVEAREVDIRKSESGGPKMETPIEKGARAEGYGAALNDAIAGYAKAHNCSRARAMEAVLAHPATSEYVRLDKALAAAQREVVGLRKLEGTAPHNAPINTSKPAPTPLVVRPSEQPVVRSSDDVLRELADEQMQKNPAMSRSRAVSMAALDPRFSEAHRNEKMRKGL